MKILVDIRTMNTIIMLLKITDVILTQIGFSFFANYTNVIINDIDCTDDNFYINMYLLFETKYVPTRREVMCRPVAATHSLTHSHGNQQTRAHFQDTLCRQYELLAK